MARPSRPAPVGHGRRPPRRPRPGARRSLATLALAPLLAACCVAAPDPEDWLAAGAAPFRTPEAALRTFRTALAGDDPFLEYRCLSTGFRRANDITQLVYLEFRERLLERDPWIRHLARAKVVGREWIAEDRVLLVAEVDAFFKTIRLRIGCVREDFFDVTGDGFSAGDAVDFEAVVRPAPGTFDEPGVALRLWAPLPEDRALADVSEVRVGREWKIDSFEVLEEPATVPSE